MSSRRPLKRVLIKVSGEVLIDEETAHSVVRQLITAHHRDIRLAIVTGGGNFVRGRDCPLSNRVATDHAGMLATVINGIRFSDMLAPAVPVLHLCAFPIPGIVAGYDVHNALMALEQKKILILSGGTGSPFFSTDSAAALRAAELRLDVILKGTSVRGVFSADPKKSRKPRFIPCLTYDYALKNRIGVMDSTAFALCMEHRIPIVIFDIRKPSAIVDLIAGKRIGSIVC
ncbi:MAG: UMP kinase [candidate division WOR-3 bacterium]